MEAADFMQQARRALAETEPGEKVRRVNALLTQDAGCLAGLDGFDPLPLEAGRNGLNSCPLRRCRIAVWASRRAG